MTIQITMTNEGMIETGGWGAAGCLCVCVGFWGGAVEFGGLRLCDGAVMRRIEFHATGEFLGEFPHPYPAREHVPGWMKGMAVDFEHGGTVKRCAPFVTAMTAGYIIPAPADATLMMSAAGEFSATGKAQYLGLHFAGQFKGSPFEGMRVVKFMNQWVIVTPPEYVCLITAPVNRFELPFKALTGIVETGSYYREVHLPMVCEMKAGETYRLLRGSPMIQVIPILREEWEHGVREMDAEKRGKQQEMFKEDVHFYKEKFWKGMRFE
jgi:hypothetical protein